MRILMYPCFTTKKLNKYATLKYKFVGESKIKWLVLSSAPTRCCILRCSRQGLKMNHYDWLSPIMGPLSVSIFPGNIISQDSGWRCIMIIDFLQWNHSLRSKGVQQEFSLFLCAMRNHMSRCPDRQKLWLKSPPHKTRWECGSAFSIFEQSSDWVSSSS